MIFRSSLATTPSPTLLPSNPSSTGGELLAPAPSSTELGGLQSVREDPRDFQDDAVVLGAVEGGGKVVMVAVVAVPLPAPRDN